MVKFSFIVKKLTIEKKLGGSKISKRRMEPTNSVTLKVNSSQHFQANAVLTNSMQIFTRIVAYMP